MQQKNWFIKTGDFFFKWRNIVFPLVLLSLFISFPPPHQYMGYEWVEEVKDVLAVLLILSGLAFRAATIGWAYIKRGGLNKKVYASELVTSGFFGLSRNPLYVGNMIIYTGVFLVHGNPFVMVFGIALYWFIYESIIAAEEFFLTQKFGNDYLEYCKSVPRWIPDFSRYGNVTEGMSFSTLRAIAKDYTTIFNAFLAIVMIEIIEGYIHHSAEEFTNITQYGLGFLAVLLCGVALISYLKKTGKFKEA